MKITFNRKTFLRWLKLVAVAVPVKGYTSILQGNVKVTVSTGSIILQATDTTTSIRAVLDSNAWFSIDGYGQTIIPAKQIIKILDKSRDQRFTLESNDKKVFLYNANENHEFDAVDPDVYPDIDIPDTSKYHRVNAADMSNMIKRTVFATGKDHVRYDLDGVCFYTDSGN